jgi:uridine kinase
VTRFPDTDVERVLEHAAARPATLGAGRLVCVDVSVGSGKSTLAAQLAGRTGAPVVHKDDLFPGWDGMRCAEPQVRGLLGALAAGRTGRYRRYDWHDGDYREEHRIEPGPLLVLEGVASGSRSWAALTTTLVWVETHPDERLRRGLARDGEAVRDHWLRWMREEEALYDEQQTRARADVVLAT